VVTKILVIIAAVAVIVLVIGAVMIMKGGAASSQASPSPSGKAASSNKPAASSSPEVVGSGTEAKEGSTISVKYTGTLTDGTVFDSTDKHGGQPVTFQLAKGQLIDGWVQGIPGMKVGGKRKLVIPPDLGYGSRGQASIPPNSTLIFEIELTDVK
jgi:FKBP-type peptidyl-prolyl cis-trans isomerase